MISQRTLFYILDNEATKSVDLRKARCIILQPYREQENNPRTNDKGPNIVVDSPNITLYLRMWTSRETKVILIKIIFLVLIFFVTFVADWKVTRYILSLYKC